jgi:hypothetical protein
MFSERRRNGNADMIPPSAFTEAKIAYRECFATVSGRMPWTVVVMTGFTHRQEGREKLFCDLVQQYATFLFGPVPHALDD